MPSPFMKRVLHLGLIFCLMVIFVPFAIAQELEEEKEEKLPTDALKALYEAQLLMQEDQYDGAIARLNEYLAKQPPDVPARVYMMLGNCWYAKENFEETRKAFEKAYEIDPSDIITLKNYANVTYQTERFVDAAALWEKLFDMEDPKQPRTLWYAAGAYYQAEDLKNSKRVLERLLRLPGTPDPQWYKLIIEISYAQEQFADVERYVLEFLTLDPLQSYYWSLLSQIRLDREDLMKGTSDLEIAYRIEAPRRQRQWGNLGELYRYVRAPLMEARCYEEAYKGDDGPEGYIRIAKAYEDALRYDEAVKILDEGIKKNPSADLYFEKGQLLYNAARFSEAVEAFEECVKLDRKRGDAYTIMGFAAWSLQNWDKARTAFADASRIPKYRAQANSAIEALKPLIELRDEVE